MSHADDFWRRIETADWDSLTRRWLLFGKRRQDYWNSHGRQPNEYVLNALSKAFSEIEEYQGQQLFRYIAEIIEEMIREDINL